jgi:hypothetical protein
VVNPNEIRDTGLCATSVLVFGKRVDGNEFAIGCFMGHAQGLPTGSKVLRQKRDSEY